ncbi:MAG: insulinase family protein, partial [Calditrichaeota bacterium]
MDKNKTQYKKTRLDNGIRVISEKIPYVRSISIGAWLTVGSRDENASNNGISHYIEHMMFKGTKNRKAYEIAESLESVGGQINAFTSKELTCYYAHILDEHLEIAVDVISDILINSVFDEQEMEKEKQVIVEEINNMEDTPEEMIHELFIKDLFPDHPLGFSTLGTRENVWGFTRQDIYDYLSRNYAKNRLVIAAAGNVDHDKLVELVETKFVEFHNSVDRVLYPPNGPRQGENIIKNGGIQAHICLGTLAYSYRDPKKFPLLILNTLLGAGMSSRLFQNIREKHGLAYSVYSFIDFLFDTGLFGVYIGTDKNKIGASIELINKELEDLKKNPVSKEEL